MIKKSINTGLMYLCKTSRNNPYQYNGSGTYWLRHIRKHNPHIITCVVGEYSSKDELKENGILLSEKYDVVSSPLWANLTPECGDGGRIHNQEGNSWTVSEQGRYNMKQSRLLNKEKYNKSHEKLIPKISGGKNYQSKHVIVTPWGKFETYRDATNEAKKLRKQGKLDVVTDRNTLKKYCECDIVLSITGRRTFQEWRGKSTTNLGFDKWLK